MLENFQHRPEHRPSRDQPTTPWLSPTRHGGHPGRPLRHEGHAQRRGRGDFQIDRRGIGEAHGEALGQPADTAERNGRETPRERTNGLPGGFFFCGGT